MNKIFKLKKCSHGLKVVSEIAKSHSGEKAVTGSGFGGFGSAFFARLGLGGDTSHGGFSFGKVAMSLATAVALSPFMISEAEALILCAANDSVTSGNAVGTKVTINKGTLTLSETSCPDGYTAVSNSISFNGGTASGTNSIAFNGGIANGTNALAAMGATANKDNTYAIGNGAITNGDNSMAFGENAEAIGNRGISIGMNSSAKDGGAIAIGSSNFVGGQTSHTINGKQLRDYNGKLIEVRGSSATGVGAVSIGSQSVAESKGQGNVAIGYLALAKNIIDTDDAGQSVAIGTQSKAIAGQTIAIGANVVANGYGSIAIGGDDIGNAASSTKSVELNKYISFLGGENAVSKRTLFLKAVFSGACEVVDGKLVNPKNKTTCSDLGLVGKEGIYKSTNASALGTLAIGQSSIASNTFANAVGFSNIASGIASNAFGTNNIANGDGGNAYGLENKVYDANGTAIGNSNIVNLGAQNSSAIGVSNTIVSGDFSTAIGASNQVTGPKAISIGSDNLNEGLNTLTVGSDNNATGMFAVAVGIENNATNTAAFAVGGHNQAKGSYSTAFGFKNLVEADDAMAFGKENNITAISDHAMALGMNNYIDGERAIAIGENNQALADYSAVIGDGNLAKAYNSFAVGSGNEIGENAEYSLTQGFYNYAEGINSVAIGTYNELIGDYANAFGIFNSVGGEGGIAIGMENNITGNYSVAVGYGHQILGSNSGAFGDPTYINSDNSYAIGNNNNIATGNDSVFILGNNVTNTLGNSVFLGDGAAYVGSGPSTAGDEDYATNGVKIGNIEAGALTFAGSKPIGVVSIGNTTDPRRIQNVAAGLISKNSTDAVNGSQLYYAIEKSTVYSDDRLVFLNNEKNITSPYLHINGVEKHPTPSNGYAQATGENAVAIGANSQANGANSTAFMGNIADGPNAMVWGESTRAGGYTQTDEIMDYETHTIYRRGGNGGDQDRIGYFLPGPNPSNGDCKNTFFYVDDNYKPTGGYTCVQPTFATDAAGRIVEADAQVLVGSHVVVTEFTNSGKNATAFGYNTSARGDESTAWGAHTIAGADRSTAFGTGSKTIGDESEKTIAEIKSYQGRKVNSFSIVTYPDGSTRYRLFFEDGKIEDKTEDRILDTNNVPTSDLVYNTKGMNSTAFGNYTIASNTNATSFGERTLASGQNATSFGNRAEANATNATAFGDQAKAGGENATAWGFKSVATGRGATAFGHATIAEGSQSTAFGNSSQAIGRNSTAFGYDTRALGENAVAWGSQTHANGGGSTAFGFNTRADGENSVAWGRDSKVLAEHNGIIYEALQDQTPNASGNKTYYVIDRATGNVLESNLGSREEADNWIKTQTGGHLLADNSTAFGNGSTVYAQNALGALGGYVSKEGENSAAIGKDANVSVADTVALGSGSKANRDNITGGRFYKGYDFETDTNSTNNIKMPDDATWVATANAIAVGDADNNITRQITGVAAGWDDTDAVNVAQLKRAVRSSIEANATTVASANGSVGVVEGTKDGHRHYDLNITDSLENIASIIGGETKYDGNKTIITNNIGDTGKNTIHEAIKAVDKNITVNGWNEANTTDGNLQLAWSDTNNTYDLSLNKDLNLTDGSITFGDSYINNNEFVVKNSEGNTTITPNGLVVNGGTTLKFTDKNVSVGGNQIHDVAKGTADDDAVNVAQLKEVEANITKVTVNGGVKAPDSGYTDGNLQLAWGGDSNNTYDLKLNKDLDLTGGSVKFGDNTYINATEYVIGTSDGNTTITASGIIINKDGDKKIEITQNNISMGDNIIHNVAAGVDDTDAVNVSQLKNSIDGNRTRTKITVDGGTEAGKNGAYAGSNLLLAETENKDGNYTFDLKLADKIKIGGGNGEDGNITVAGKDGKDGVSITAADGVGTIGLNGKDGKNATITIGKGKDTLTDKEPGRIIYKTTDNTGKEIELQVATMNDGLKFDGNYQQGTDKAIEKALNDTMTIKGTHTAGADKLSKGNIGVINDGKDLIVELAKDIKLDKGSITITSQDGSKTVNISGDNVDMGGNQIHNVAAGTADTDAVNVSQLKQTQQDVTNITNIVNGDPSGSGINIVTYNVYDQSEHHNQNVLSAINNMNEQGIKFFHTNQTGITIKDDNKNYVDSSAKGGYATAIGVQAQANGKESLAIGHGAIASGEKSIAIGTGNQVLANNAGAFGDPNTVAAGADGSYVIGNNNNITTNDTFVIGNSSDPKTPKVTVANSLFFGNDAAYVDENTKGKNGEPVSKGNATYEKDEVKATNANGDEVTITMKQFAGGDQVVGVVSVGNGSQTRRIQNVAPGLIGKDSTDAINGSQLYSALEGVAEHLGGQINQTNQAVNNLANQLGEAKKEYRGGIASAIAIGNLPQSTIPGKGMLSVGTGYYKDQGSLSLGLSKMSDNGKWIFKSSLSYDTQENVGAGLSLGFHF